MKECNVGTGALESQHLHVRGGRPRGRSLLGQLCLQVLQGIMHNSNLDCMQWDMHRATQCQLRPCQKHPGAPSSTC